MPVPRRRCDPYVRARSLLASLLLLCAGCPEEDDAPAAAPLCDGSAAARLTYINGGGGPPPSSFAFTGAYGYEFFVIDGTCRYWAGAEYLKGIRTGTLSAAAGDDIARRLHRADLARLKSFGGRGCPDASTRTLSDGVNHVSCTCDCTYQSPPEYAETFANLTVVHGQLMDGGTPAALPIRVVALAAETAGQPAPVTWPLAWSPREVLAPELGLSTDSGRLVTDAAELATLRTLRAGTNPLHLSGVKVRDAAGDVFLVLPRDQAPPEVLQAFSAIR